jgi:(2Fe-2S) ferredoxin
MFTLGEMECMGACVNAPMIAVADYTKGVDGFSYTYYEDLTPADTVAIIDTLKKGGKPKVRGRGGVRVGWGWAQCMYVGRLGLCAAAAPHEWHDNSSQRGP